MVVVKVEKNNDLIEKITFMGHAEFADYGKDIVCASLSTMLITTVNACISFDKESVKYENNDKFILTNIKKDDITNKLLNNLYNLMKELESEYQDNIEIKE